MVLGVVFWYEVGSENLESKVYEINDYLKNENAGLPDWGLQAAYSAVGWIVRQITGGMLVYQHAARI